MRGRRPQFNGHVGADWRNEARRLRRRAIAMLACELAPGTPQRDQLDALATDCRLDPELLVLAQLVICQAAKAVARLDRQFPDLAAPSVWPPDPDEENI